MAKPEEQEATEDEVPESEEPLGTREELEARGDAAGLRELAKAYRSGTGVAKDIKASFSCYEAAAKLGDAEAHNALALFYFTGVVVPVDFKEGAAHLRAAADGGALDAKVHLANLYELGVHYGKDAEKADVWYRSAARAAGLNESDDEYETKMAELGSVRHALPIIEDEATPADVKQRLLRKLRARGYKPASDTTARESLPSAPPVAPKKIDEAPKPEEVKPDKEKPKKPSRLTWRSGAVALAYMIFFAGVAIGAGFLVGEGAKTVHALRGGVPLFGHRVELIFPAVTTLILLPASLLMYRARTVGRALLLSLIAGAVGLTVHGSKIGTLLASRETQTLTFALGVYLAVLIVFGFVGGAKRRRR